MRRLSRRAKDRTCAHQFAECGYCGCTLCDAFQVDHLDEDCSNDHEDNIVATCGTCHSIKTMHYRKRRTDELDCMLGAVCDRRCTWETIWADDTIDHWDRIPAWLRSRVGLLYIRMHAAIYHPCPPQLDLDQFRYRGSA